MVPTQDELVRLCSFGSLVLWISLGSPSDLLYRPNCSLLIVGSLVFTQLFIAGNSRRGKRFMPITLKYTLKLKI